MTREEQIELAWQQQQKKQQATRWYMRRPPTLSPELRDRLAEAQNWRCCYCGVRMMGESWKDPTMPTFEHVKRKADGGTDDLDNIAIACNRCNTSREDTDPMRYAMKLACTALTSQKTKEKRDGRRQAA